MFEYSIAGYTGPLDYLASLIDKRKLELSEVSLRDIAQEFVQYVAERDIPAEELASWLRVASRLIYIKTRYVSGVVESCREEDIDSDDMISQLRILKIFKERESVLDSTWNLVIPIIEPAIPETFEDDMDPNIDVQDMKEHYIRCMQRYKEKTPVPKHITDTYIAIESMMRRIALCVSANPVSLSTMPEAQSRKNMVALFLAVLELLKQRHITVAQDSHHGDIHITHRV